MQDTPNNYLGNYFFELKREVDLEFSLIEKEEDKEKEEEDRFTQRKIKYILFIFN